MYVINNANLVQSAMRNKTLEFGARIEEIGRIMGVDPVIVKRLVKENAVEEISRVTVSALSGENLLTLNLNALKYIGGRFNEVKPGSPLQIDDVHHWSRDLIGQATTRALYGEHSPFNNPELVDAIWYVLFCALWLTEAPFILSFPFADQRIIGPMNLVLESSSMAGSPSS